MSRIAPSHLTQQAKGQAFVWNISMSRTFRANFMCLPTTHQSIQHPRPDIVGIVTATLPWVVGIAGLTSSGGLFSCNKNGFPGLSVTLPALCPGLRNVRRKRPTAIKNLGTQQALQAKAIEKELGSSTLCSKMASSLFKLQ